MRSDGTRRYLQVFAGFCAAWAVLIYTSFFFNLNSTLSDWSGVGVTWSYQWFYNFLHGRPFQSSVWAATPGGISVGFTDNAYAYLHGHSIHSNFTPYLFAYVWALWPTLSWLYGIIYAWSLGAGAWLTVLILKELDPKNYRPKALFAVSVLVASGLSNVLDQLAHFLLFAGPVMMAAYYFMLAGRRVAYLATIVFLCLISEDAAMVAVAFGGYVLLFEAGKKFFAFATWALALPYLAFVFLILQPTTRVPLTLLTSTTTATVVGHVFHITRSALSANLASMLPVVTLLPAFILGALLFDRKPYILKHMELFPGTVPYALRHTVKTRLLGPLALALIPAFPHWGECVVVGSAHHLLPPMIYTYLALLSMIGTSRISENVWANATKRRAILAVTAVFVLLSVRTTAGKLPNAVKPGLYRLLGKIEKAEVLEKALTGQRESNMSVIAAAQALPPEASLSYAVNKTVSGFISGRSDLWQFPDFFDLTDYILIQKDATDLIFQFDPVTALDLRGALKKGQYADTRDAPMTAVMRAALRDTLVKKEKTHRVAFESEHVLLLERLQKHRFYVAPETMGLGWMKNLGRKQAVVDRRL
jgi:hypothetical protein